LPAAITPGASEPIAVYVLYIDVVDSTSATVDEQNRVNTRLRDVVMGTGAFQSALKRQEVLSLPSGDGLALVFLKGIDAPLRCAVEIAEALKSDPFCKLRAGIHAGPVILEPDITGKPNVSGDGINLAARVMSCGGAGDILLTRSAADLVRNLSAWRGKLHHVGERRAKRDVLDVWSYSDGSVGNSATKPPLQRANRTGWWIGAAVGVLLIAGLALIPMSRRRGPGPPSGAAQPPQPAAQEIRLGMNLWRMLPSPANATYKRRGLRYSREDTGREDWTPQLVSVQHSLHAGDHVRITIQSYQSGYLYVIDRDVFGDGKRSQPELIFPTREIRGGNNQIQAGEQVGIPPETDLPPTFDVVRTKPNQTGILITLILAPTPLGEIQVQKTAQSLSEALVAGWESKWSSQSKLSENAALSGALYTQEDKAAEDAGRAPAGEPITVFSRMAKPGEPIVGMAMIRLEP
jgi:class 3 adenylate cyclase